MNNAYTCAALRQSEQFCYLECCCKLPAFREFLEEHAYQLSNRCHMSDLVPSF